MKDQISEFLQSRIDENDFPSAVYLVAERGKIIFQDALGLAIVEPIRVEAKLTTIYDLASLTKVLVTGLLCAKLIERGVLNLQDKISKYFGEFEREEKREITIENLLTHTSGFRGWFPFYLFINRKEKRSIKDDVLFQIINLPLENPINKKVVYSDLNFILLGFLLEKIHGKSLDCIAKEEIFKPLQLRNTFYNPPRSRREEFAASEFGNYHEKKTCFELGYLNSFYDARDYKREQEAGIDVMEYIWRDYQICGEVHDGNCWFMDGVSGHAGLFSNAEETFKIAQQFLAEESVLLKTETCALFRTNFTPGLNEARSIGFQLAETPESTASPALAKDSFGHLGFTGTSLWIEPESERIFILLTNRTHAHELPFVNINSVRRKFHELAQAALNSAR
ncbi:MAG TPA: serine hydrolase domain-containing protein [Pyrinomonadaceae bacterium]|nr:serine hydrolase domain-containing protein [Pyrinomonadaceae bacterium]